MPQPIDFEGSKFDLLVSGCRADRGIGENYPLSSEIMSATVTVCAVFVNLLVVFDDPEIKRLRGIVGTAAASIVQAISYLFLTRCCRKVVPKTVLVPRARKMVREERSTATSGLWSVVPPICEAVADVVSDRTKGTRGKNWSFSGFAVGHAVPIADAIVAARDDDAGTTGTKLGERIVAYSSGKFFS